MSVGVVISEKSNSIKKSQLQVDKDKDVAHYHNQLLLAPGVQRLLGNATFNGSIKSASDYSYSAEMNHYAGPHYRIAGDAGGELLLVQDLPITEQKSFHRPSLLVGSSPGIHWWPCRCCHHKSLDQRRLY